MLDKSMVGREFESFSYRVEKNKIKEFCLALEDENPIFVDEAAAKDAGHEDTPVPLTFQTSFIFWGFPQIWERMEQSGIDTKRLLHMKEDYDYIRPIYPGITITGKTKITDVKTGKMDMVTFETTFTNEQQEVMIQARMSIVMRPE